MPSGRIHDRITLWSLPLVAGTTWWVTHSSQSTLVLAGGFLFSGLMFGPDLDIYSRQFQRWGWLRWIWLPYRKSVQHRSLWSHGFLIGTTLRVLYLMLWIGLFCGLGFWLWQGYQWVTSAQPLPMDWHSLQAEASWNRFQQWTIGQIGLGKRLLQRHQEDAIALFIGLESGAMSHCMSDWIHSSLKSLQKRMRMGKPKR